jgi:hypothetical protein
VISTIAPLGEGSSDVSTFDVFAQGAKEQFHYLLTEFGFSSPADRQYSIGRVLEYSNAATRVRVNYELGSLPWVTLHRIGNPSGRIRGEGINLDGALAHFGLSPPITDWSPKDVPDEVLRQMIAFQAEALRKTCEPYLKGEFDQEWTSLVEEQRAVFERRRSPPKG